MPAVAAPDLEALRRACYAPGATDHDRERYRAALAAREPAAPSSGGAAPPALRQRPRQRRRPALLLALAVAAGACTAALAAPHAAPQVASTPSASGSTFASTFLRAPRTAAPAPRPSIGHDARTVFLANLGRGRAAGISGFLAANPTAALLHADLSTIVELHGTGAATRTIDSDASWVVPGHATVLFVLGSPARAGWAAYRRYTSGGGSSAIAGRVGTRAAGALTVTTFDYGAGARPVRLTVEAPDGVAWGAAVLLTR
ncbi:hypothetical protein QDR37_11490 [Amnibacterium sp. CER49]|uniref:hypothetical protein n=1 Tax=Amnibacterium sp. CER49 TaxID=3039161 RepID=UPI00244A0C76|nr:hypothetical protein [Amnibacterium sp. CER49]MDH2444569.1 hypothetical protein [Amnibacterium sp. CER49]